MMMHEKLNSLIYLRSMCIFRIRFHMKNKSNLEASVGWHENEISGIK